MKQSRNTNIRYSFNKPKFQGNSARVQSSSFSNARPKASRNFSSNKSKSSIFSFLENSWSSTVYFQILGVLVVTVGVLVMFQNYSSDQMNKITENNIIVENVDSKAKLVPIFNTTEFETREKNIASFIKNYEQPKPVETATNSDEQIKTDNSEANLQSAKNIDVPK